MFQYVGLRFRICCKLCVHSCVRYVCVRVIVQLSRLVYACVRLFMCVRARVCFVLFVLCGVCLCVSVYLCFVVLFRVCVLCALLC